MSEILFYVTSLKLFLVLCDLNTIRRDRQALRKVCIVTRVSDKRSMYEA